MKVRRETGPVAGFRAAGIHAGIKKTARDLAFIVADAPASVAAVFTRSTIVGAPVEVSRRHLALGRSRGVIVNSGCSNVAMGERGIRDARRMAGLAARELGCELEEILVCSTGVIGQPLPLDVLRVGIPKVALALSPDGFGDASEAIRTTDTHAKPARVTLRLDGREVTIQGIAKGSGMIEPNMATMLSFIVTDAAIPSKLLQKMLGRVADATYNRLSVDGEGSTSDTVVLMASGACGGASMRAGSDSARRFEAALHAVCEDLTRQLARDGEGATKLVIVDVAGARNADEADRAVRRIGNSMLVKTAIFGGDPNWGRIMQTIGAERIPWHPEKTRVHVGGVAVFAKGRSAGPAARARAEKALAAEEIRIEVDLGMGRAAARLYTCDLTYEYIRVNAEYTT
ncbi:MAG: bifunctional glutamate N-acetyltransferase/amino-acid acetyltransferase ArgJ [Spirochaetaceae bacterium]|nr:bifunctional glutamate N-acetyltransferase/amino-acid acetyltransferase ArgJ [Spirochaetaceae bacterium]